MKKKKKAEEKWKKVRDELLSKITELKKYEYIYSKWRALDWKIHREQKIESDHYKTDTELASGITEAERNFQRIIEKIKEKRILKIFVVGKKGVGRTSFLVKTTNNVFNKDYKSTIGVDFFIKEVKFKGKIYKFQIWTIESIHEYPAVSPLYMRGAVAALLLYDITDKESLDFFEFWTEEIKKLSIAVRVFLIGTKLDLEERRQTNMEDALRFLKKHDFQGGVVEVSSKMDYNLEKPFELICEKFFSK